MSAASRSRLRVLSVINGLGTGGAERSLVELHEPLRERGIDVDYACFYARSEGVEERLRATGAKVDRIGAGGWRPRTRALRALLRQREPDLLHTTLFEANVSGRLASVRTGIPVLTSLVNTSYERGRVRDPNVGRVKLEAVRLIDAATSRLLCTHFHAITRAVKESAVRRLGLDADRVTVIHRGRDPERLGEPSLDRRLRTRRLLGVPEEAPVLLNVARQEFQKGQEVLLRAFDRLSGAHPRLLIAGREGNASPALRRTVEDLEGRDRVRFLGHRDDVPDLLAAADVFVFPSHYEGLGGAVIEAMALGLPVVASDLPAVREIVEAGQSAELVPPADVSALAAALQRLLDDRERRVEMGRRGRQIFLERFTLERCADRTAELYRAVVAGAAKGLQEGSQADPASGGR